MARSHGVGEEEAEAIGDPIAVEDGVHLKTGRTVTLELALKKGAGVVNGTNVNVEIGTWKEIRVVTPEMSVITGQICSAQKRSLAQTAYSKNLRHTTRRYRLHPLHHLPRLLDLFQIGIIAWGMHMEAPVA